MWPIFMMMTNKQGRVKHKVSSCNKLSKSKVDQVLILRSKQDK